MGRFDGVEKEKPKTSDSKLPRIAKGEYTVEVLCNKIITDKSDQEALVREFRVLESVGEGASPVGSEVSSKLLYLNDKWVKPRIAEYIRALTSAKTVDSKLCEQIFGPENPAKGKRVKLRVYTADNAKGEPYDRYDFRYDPTGDDA